METRTPISLWSDLFAQVKHSEADMSPLLTHLSLRPRGAHARTMLLQPVVQYNSSEMNHGPTLGYPTRSFFTSSTIPAAPGRAGMRKCFKPVSEHK